MEYGLQLGKEMASSDMVQNENGSGTTLIVSDMNITGLEDGGLIDEGYDSPLLMPPWEIALTVLALSGVIALTIVGNILVILSVFTYKPLRIVQNFFIVSLAVADLTVAVFVLPFNVAYIIIGKWVFGIHLCEMWLTFDILCCTASILNLCAIALDRYWAITDPLNYAQKRTLKRVMIMIASVWIISVIICLPPLFGWNDWPEVFTEETRCMLTQQKGFIIYSSSGSFYLPLVIMSIVYLKIFLATKRRLRERAQASKLNQINSNKRIGKDDDSVMSENGQNGYNDSYKRKLVMKKRKKKRGGDATTSIMSLAPPPGVEESVTEQDVSPIKTEAPPLCRQESDKAEVVVKMIPGGRSQIHQFIEEKQKISLSKERRAARTLGIIMGVFVVCWLPFFLMYVILPFCPACTKPSDKVINFITWLGYINSALNPMIYTIFNLDFRRAFARILKCSNLVAV